MASSLMYPQNSEEKRALVQFREEITDLPLDNDDVDDHFLLRWLRARELNPVKAKEMLRNYLNFMESYEGNKDLANWIPPAIITDNLQFKFIGNDSEGRLVGWLPIGRLDARKLVEAGEELDLTRYLHQLMQNAVRLINEHKKLTQATQVITIVDMAEFSYRKFYHMPTIKFVISFMQVFEANYPEILYKAHMINAPRTCYFLFNMVKPFLSSRTLAKLEFHSCDSKKWRPVLLENIPLAVLPLEYGGTGDSLYPENTEE